MSFSAVLGRYFDWHGRAGRFEFFKVWALGGLLTLLSVVPLFFYFWKLTQDTVDYGFDAAMLMMVEQEAGLLYYVLVCLWQWLSAVVLTGMFVMALMTTVRRLVDMGFSPWWVILSSVPLINIVFLLMLFFWPGQRAAAQ